MTLKELKTRFKEQLRSIYDPNEIELLFHTFLEDKTGISKITYLSNPDTILQDSIEESLLLDLDQLGKNVPYQYILGHAPFLNMTLSVSPAVLIPRPETEELAMLIRERCGDDVKPKVLDIGTGSGCLALACAQYWPEGYVEAWDISEEALKVASLNASNLGLKLELFRADVLDQQSLKSESWDIIVSNPPYIAEAEGTEMEIGVKDHEPNQALFVPNDDPLIFYKAIANYAFDKLEEGGRIFLEINQRLGRETLAVFQEKGYACELIRDLSSNDRFVIAHK